MPIMVKPEPGTLKMAIYGDALAVMGVCMDCRDDHSFVWRFTQEDKWMLTDNKTLEGLKDAAFIKWKESHKPDCYGRILKVGSTKLDNGIANLIKLKEKFGEQALKPGFISPEARA